jgi:hypothetical protein
MKVKILKGVLKGKVVDLIGMSYGVGATIKEIKNTIPYNILAEARIDGCHLAVVDTSKELRVNREIMYYLFNNIEFLDDKVIKESTKQEEILTSVKNMKKPFFITSDRDGDYLDSFNSIEEAIEYATSEVNEERGRYEAYISAPILKIVRCTDVNITKID